MKRRLSAIIFALVLPTLLLAGCIMPTEMDPAAKTAVAQTLDAIVGLSATPDDTPTPTVTATSTAIPPTATPEATPTITPTPTEVIQASGPNNFPPDVNPLTGLKVQDAEILDRRPVMIKVANYPAVGRPHAGLSAADIVFEYYIGAGANRFMALYYGQDSEKIGPMRSGRLVDTQLVSMYEGILGFWSADARVYDNIVGTLGNRAISGSDNTCPAMCDDGRGIVTSKFADSQLVGQLAESRGVANTKYNLDGMRFDPAAPAEGALGKKATVWYSDGNVGEWRYDDASGKYLRWIEDVDIYGNLSMIPLVDSNTNKQLGFSNVIVLLSYYTEYSPTLHDISVWDNTGGMEAIIFRDGKGYEVTWKSTGRDYPIQFKDASGSDFALKPGNSWMIFIGSSSLLDVTEGSWTFTSYLP